MMIYLFETLYLSPFKLRLYYGNIISIEKLSEVKNEYVILVQKYTEILNTKARVVNIDGSESDNN